MPLTGIRVLVVDDHSDSLDMFEEALTYFHAHVTTVRTAEAAAARLGDVDVVITDYALPAHNGVWLLEQLEASALEIPMILVSGFAANQVPEVAAAPFALKLLKPIDPLELGRQVARLLGRQAN